ncbi:MAG: methyltransferase domain-containing protein [Archangium sp.]|nr:methyltransferase domain-containing protein [Archangium sp.]
MVEASARQAFSPDVLRRFGDVIRERFGLAQTARREDGLEHRLTTAMKLANAEHEDPNTFVRRLASAPERSTEFQAAADAVPNQETSFFRDAQQLEGVVRTLVAKRLATAAPGDVVRVLSAGCATGEEVYSLAMLLHEALAFIGGPALEVWGLDVSPGAVAHAVAGRYPVAVLQRSGDGPVQWSRGFFREVNGVLEARPFLRATARFVQGNLMSPETLERLGRFEVVLCRNVLIYFDAETLPAAMRALRSLLVPAGALVLGRAEASRGEGHGLEALRQGDLCWLVRSDVEVAA